MARKATGAVVEHVGRDGAVYRSLRFTAYGKRRFVSLGAVSDTEAQQQLRYTLADVERGVWQPPEAVEPPKEPEPVPTFKEFCEQWWTLSEGQWRANTVADYEWRLSLLLPFFGDRRLDEITYKTVEEYVAGKLSEAAARAQALKAWEQLYAAAKTASERRTLRKVRPPKPLCARSINMTVVLLGAILESALEEELIVRNPAKGKRRRVKEGTPRRSYLDSAEQIEALLKAAGKHGTAARALLATLTFAGLRISELCNLRWRDVDLASGWLTVRASKTDAGVRKVKIRAGLRDELTRIKPVDVNPDRFMFGPNRGKPENPSNIRNRVLGPAVTAASEALVASDMAPLPEHVTPHSLRRTFASLLCAIGEPATVTMAEMGHTSPNLTLRVYAQAMRRDEDQAKRLKALIDGTDQPDELADSGILQTAEAFDAS